MYTKTHLEIGSKSKEELLKLFYAYQRAIDVNIISSITDTFGKILHVNDKFCHVSKYSREELIGQNHRIINSGYHPNDFFKEMWLTLEQGKMWQNEIKNKAKDGSYYWVDTVILPVLNQNGKIEQYLSLRLLITEKKQVEEERKIYTYKLKEMLYMTSHRLRAPLTTCLGLMNLVEDGKILNEKELQEVILHLKKSALELDRFTTELTEFIHETEKDYNS